MLEIYYLVFVFSGLGDEPTCREWKVGNGI